MIIGKLQLRGLLEGEPHSSRKHLEGKVVMFVWLLRVSFGFGGKLLANEGFSEQPQTHPSKRAREWGSRGKE